MRSFVKKASELADDAKAKHRVKLEYGERNNKSSSPVPNDV